MKSNLHKLIAVVSAISLTATAVWAATGKDGLEIRNNLEATALVKVLNKELGLSERQKVRIEKLFEAYMRRVELARIAYSDDKEMLNKRLALLNKYKNNTLAKELGEEKVALFEVKSQDFTKKVSEMKKLISGK
ncbi:MAG: hypothetical protein KF706_10355 [Chitinophagales bacterium]|nr:hypothetical protein [Chitinophagales bacterium]